MLKIDKLRVEMSVELAFDASKLERSAMQARSLRGDASAIMYAAHFIGEVEEVTEEMNEETCQ